MVIDARFHPLDAWPQADTPVGDRGSRLSFKASFNDTLEILDRELYHLDAEDIVIETFHRRTDIRVDGWPRANAAQPHHPGVIVSFASRFGPLRYLTDHFERWEHNLRAIALGLEALRKVDRYGITQRGEQYTGWKALPPGIAVGPANNMTVEAAAAFIASNIAGVEADAPTLANLIVDQPEALTEAYRIAALKLHPDTGGDPAEFRRLQDAKHVLEAHHARSAR